jgi:hypothetical protein
MDIKEILMSGLVMIMGLIMLAIGIGFLPGVFESTATTIEEGNITGVQATAVNAIPTFASLGLMIAGIFLTIGPFGLLGWKMYKNAKKEG